MREMYTQGEEAGEPLDSNTNLTFLEGERQGRRIG